MDDSLVAGEGSDGGLATCSVDVSLSQIQLEEKDEESDDEERELRNLAEYDYQIFVLSQYGRPIFVSSGQEDKLCALFALIGVFVSRVKAWNDTLESFSAGNVHVHFAHRPPLILAVVSKRPDWLAAQLDVIYDQIVSTLSKTQLDTVYDKKGDNYDLRRLLRGTDKSMMNCVSTWRSDPALYLSAIRVFPLSGSEREALSTQICTAITSAKTQGILFAIVISHRQLVCLVRFKKYIIHQNDVHIIMNVVANNQSLRNGETWTPICLPKFNNSGFLHAHISYPWDGLEACMILLSTKREDFFALSAIKADITSRVTSNASLLSSLTKAFTKPATFDCSPIGRCNEHLWYFVYKNRNSQQLCLCGSRPPFISREERRALNRSISSAAFVARSHSGLKMAFVRRKHDALNIRWGDKLELICVMSPLVTVAAANFITDQLLRLLKNSEHRYFITHTPSF